MRGKSIKSNYHSPNICCQFGFRFSPVIYLQNAQVVVRYTSHQTGHLVPSVCRTTTETEVNQTLQSRHVPVTLDELDCLANISATKKTAQQTHSCHRISGKEPADKSQCSLCATTMGPRIATNKTKQERKRTNCVCVSCNTDI